jgi:hypothetical protein
MLQAAAAVVAIAGSNIMTVVVAIATAVAV